MAFIIGSIRTCPITDTCILVVAQLPHVIPGMRVVRTTTVVTFPTGERKIIVFSLGTIQNTIAQSFLHRHVSCFFCITKYLIELIERHPIAIRARVVIRLFPKSTAGTSSPQLVVRGIQPVVIIRLILDRRSHQVKGMEHSVAHGSPRHHQTADVIPFALVQVVIGSGSQCLLPIIIGRRPRRGVLASPLVIQAIGLQHILTARPTAGGGSQVHIHHLV